MKRKGRPTTSSAARADELFAQHREEIYRNTDKLFARLMVVQWIAGIIAALLISPRTWSGQTTQIHAHVWGAIFIGGVISAFPIWMTRAWPGRTATRHVVAVAQVSMSALLIDLTGGRIETHFHVFGSLVILSFYRDWKVLVPATIVVAVDHFLRGLYIPFSVYGVLTASPWRSLEHAGWVIFEDVFLVISCLRSIREMRSIANRTAALEKSEQNFRQIFEEAPIGMAVVDLDERFTKANNTLCHMVGYSEEELKERTPLDITYPDDVDRSKELAQQMLNGSKGTRVEKRYVNKAGEMLWATRTGCIMRDELGNPQHFLIMVEDISERKRTEEALRNSRHELEIVLHANQLIMDNSQDVICMLDEEGHFLTINPACEKLWGYTPDELIGRNYIDLVYEEDRDKTNNAAVEIRAKGTISNFVNRYVRKDGALVDVLWSATWSEADKKHFCVAHDMTERAKIEKDLREAKDEADRANRAKSEFLSRMSHELRTPLNAILGFGQLLERQDASDKQRAYMKHILGAGRHLLNLINEVLDISRIEAGTLQLSLEPVCLADALNEALDLMRPFAAEREIKLKMPSAPEDSHFVMADRQRFKQVLLNLLTNAIKYTHGGGAVTVSHSAFGADKIRVRVTDTGCGIAAEKLSRLFTPFDRLGAEQSSVEGTGLGLALCQRLMRAMHGVIGVESEIGRGSEFWVELPCAKSPLARITSEERPAANYKSAADRRTILYIEDNVSNLALIEQLFAEEAHVKLLTAMQGQLGLDLARQHSPDLILLDLHLPDLPGWKVLAQLQADERTRAIPVIVLSADATPRQMDRLMAAGARAYLTKPLDMSSFFRVLEETTHIRPSEEPVAVT